MLTNVADNFNINNNWLEKYMDVNLHDDKFMDLSRQPANIYLNNIFDA